MLSELSGINVTVGLPFGSCFLLLFGLLFVGLPTSLG